MIKRPVSNLPLYVPASLMGAQAPPAVLEAATKGVKHETRCLTNDSEPFCRSGEQYAIFAPNIKHWKPKKSSKR